MAASITLWEGMAKRVGVDIGYRQCGVLVPFHSARFRAENEAWLVRVRDARHAVRVIDSAAAERLSPEMRLRFDGALYSPTDGRAEPQRAAPAIARAAQARGATVLTNCAVRVVETAAGAVSGVVTECGPIAASCVIVAGGVWSRLLLRGVGVDLPQLKVLNSVLRTGPVPDGPSVTMRGPAFSARRREDGGYTVSTLASNIFDLTPDAFRLLPKFLPMLAREWRSLRPRLTRTFLEEAREARPISADRPSPFERVRVLDPAPDRASGDRAMARLAEVFEAFRGASVAQRWAGLIDVTPDAVPVISTVAHRPGLVVATGFSGHGFGLGPAAGRLAADLAVGAPPVVDPAAFRLSRFFDGSPITPLTGV